jgi:uncharacterized damage-inducible protein DinB
MLTHTLQQLFNRDLDKLSDEINAYQNESNMWLTTEDVSNCAGNLCLHIAGNLKAFIGAELGQTGYIRQRDLEFSQKNVPREDLLKDIEAVKGIVSNTLSQLTVTDLEKKYPLEVFKKPMTTAFFLVHLSTHLAYHLGQINYHRRLLDK